MPSSASSTLLARAREDDNVVGVVLHGSRARGLYVTEQSDLDAIFVVRELRGAYPSRHGDPVEVVEVTSLERLPGWMLAALTWTEPTLDKTGEVAEQLRTVTAVDPATAGEPLDGYINMYYRSAKDVRVGLELAALLDAQGVAPVLPRVRLQRPRAGSAVQQVARVGAPRAPAAGCRRPRTPAPHRDDRRPRRPAGALPRRRADRADARPRRDGRRLGARRGMAPRALRTRFRMTARRRGATAECERRTQGASIAALWTRPRTPARAGRRGPATQRFILKRVLSRATYCSRTRDAFAIPREMM
jgi:hypothetical protein